MLRTKMTSEQEGQAFKKSLLDFAKDCEQLAAICERSVLAHRGQSTACQQSAAHYNKQAEACLATAEVDEIKGSEYRLAAKHARENAGKF